MIRLGLKVPDHGPGAVQEPARPREVRVHRRALQPAVRPRRGGRARRLPAVHEAVRRRRLGRRLPDQGRRRAAPRLRRVRRDADAPAGVGRGVRRVRPVAVDRRRDDGDELRPRPADARPLLGVARLPLPRGRRRGGVDRPDRQRVLPVGVQLLRDPGRGPRGAPDRLRERLPGRRDHVAALLLPVGDEGAASSGRCSAPPPAASRSPHVDPAPWFTIADRDRPVVRREAGRLRARWPTTTSTPSATGTSARRGWPTSTRSRWTTSRVADFDRVLSRRSPRRSRRTSTTSSSRTYRGLLGAWCQRRAGPRLPLVRGSIDPPDVGAS